MEEARVSNAVVLVFKLAPALPPPMPSHKGSQNCKSKVSQFSQMSDKHFLIDTGQQLHSVLPGQGGEVLACQGVDKHPLRAHAALPWQVLLLSLWIVCTDLFD